MTIALHTTTKSTVTVWHHVLDDVKGYMFSIPGAAPMFLDEPQADQLARYMLFAEPDTAVDEPVEEPVHRSVEAHFSGEGNA